jgi:branched-chain amino acid transport system substrate-binding protein
MKRLFLVCGCFALLCAFGLGQAFAKTIRIGLMCPLTGSWASEGQDMKQIVELLAKETNKAGGLGGSEVEIIVEDDGGDPRQAASAANKLVTKGVVAVIGTYGSSVTEAAQTIYDEAGIVHIATGSTAIRLTKKNSRSFFALAPATTSRAKLRPKPSRPKGRRR